MANVLVNDLYLSDIADAIREKLDTEDTYKPSEMANAIESISGGGITPTGTKSITANGTYDVTSYASANVNVPTGGATLQAKTNISPTTSSQTITADSGYDGLSSVQINAMPTQTLPSSASDSATGTQKAVIGKSTSARYLNIPTGYNGTAQYYQLLGMDLQSLPITENGTYNASTYDLDGFSSVTVNVSGGGGGTTPTAAKGLKACLESIGFTVSEFDVTSPDAGNYCTIPHSLGSVPTMIIAFNQDIFTEVTWSGYQLGCCQGDAVGQDNNNNRTYSVAANAASTQGSLFATVLTEATSTGFPTFGNRSSYNFCNGATASSVLIRNQTGQNATKMVGTKWYLAVR